MPGNVADLLLHLRFKNDASTELRRATKELEALNRATAGTRPSAADATRMAQLERQSMRAYSQVAKVGQELNRLGNRMSLFVTAPILAFFYQSTQAASDMAEQVNKASVVFGRFYGDIARQSKTAPKDLLLSPRQYLNYVGTFGAFLSGTLKQGDNAKMSQSLVSIGANLASFYNTSTEDALTAIRSGLTGQIRPLRRYGINLSQEEVSRIGKEMGTFSGTGTQSQESKLSSRAELIRRQSALSEGDIARTQGNAAQKTKELTAQYDKLKVTVGTDLLPIYKEFLRDTINVLSFFNALPGPIRGSALALLAFGAALGPIMKIWGNYMRISAALRINRAATGGAGLLSKFLGGGGGGAAALPSYAFNYAPGSLALEGLTAAGPSMAVSAAAGGGAATAAEAAGIGVLGAVALPVAAAAAIFGAHRFVDNKEKDKWKSAAKKWVATNYSGTDTQSIKSLETASANIRAQQDQQKAIIDAAKHPTKYDFTSGTQMKRHVDLGEAKADYKALGDQLSAYGTQLGILRQQEAEADDEMGYTAAIKDRINAMDELEKKVQGAGNAMKGFNNIMSYNASKRSDFAQILQDKENVAKYGQQWWGTVPGLDARDALISSAQDRAMKAASLPEGAVGKIEPNQVAQYTEQWARDNLSQVGLSIDTADLQAALSELQGVQFDVILHPVIDVKDLPPGWEPSNASWRMFNAKERQTTPARP